MSAEALELAAWRFLAAHRVAGLHVSHVQFIDGAECRLSTPSCLEFYESAGGKTFGEAAIKLALALGMPWPSRCPAVHAVLGDGSSSAPTATRPNGESAKTSPPTLAETEGSTIGATGVARDTDESSARFGERMGWPTEPEPEHGF